MKKVFGLVDCNNFFVSCERVFNPDLEDRPTVVLSNNDGCVIARSNEVKRLDVPMGAPYFKVERQLKSIDTAVLSANFQLYGDMSWRVAELLRQYSPYMEVYSIDEAFLELSDLPISEHSKWAREVHLKIKKCTGLPVSVGVGSTKTLAKLAADRAKKEPKWLKQGGLSLIVDSTRGVTPRANSLTEEILKTSPVMDVWGIGRRLGPKLNSFGIHSAWDVIQLEDDWIRRKMTVKGLRTIKELRGESCIDINENSFEDGQKTIAATRTFGHAVRSMGQLEAAIATFAARVAAKLRRKGQQTEEIKVFLATGKHSSQSHYPSASARLPYPTADTGLIIEAALSLLRTLPSSHLSYKRGGLMASRLSSASARQMPLFGGISGEDIDRGNQLMRSLDQLNHRYGKGTITHAVQGVNKQSWHSNRKQVSPAYTSSWSQIVKVV